jgi:hypothetical protein
VHPRVGKPRTSVSAVKQSTATPSRADAMRLRTSEVQRAVPACVGSIRCCTLALAITVVARAADAQTDSVRRVLTPSSTDTVTTAVFDSLSAAGRKFTGVVADRHPDGRLKLVRSVVAGAPTGLWTEWYETGIVRYLAEWHPEGKGEGVWFYFHETGVVRDRTVLRRDVSVGLSEGWHPDGTKAFEGQYVRGRRDGLWRHWGTDGRLEREVVFAADTARTLNASWNPRSAPPCATPCLFASGLISTDADEFRFVFSNDAKEAYFTRRADGGVQRIFVTRYRDGQWTAPAVAPFSTDIDEEPFVSADGERLIFSSRRPMPDGTLDRSDNLWIADRVGDSWSVPRALPRLVNRPRRTDSGWPVASEMGGTVMRAGSLLFWSAPSDPRNADIFVAPAVGTGFGRPVPIGAPINSPAFESAPVVSPDGRLLVFQREGAADGMGKEDLYVADRTGTGWGEPRLLGGGISTTANESFPSFTPDGASLVFSSDRGGNWSIYVVSVASFASTARR